MAHPLIELSGVSFAYGSFNVLDEIDLHLHPGQFVGLVGPSGAGKTSLLKLVLRLLEPTEGKIERVRSDLRLTYVPQIETVDWSFPVTAEEVVLMGLDHRQNIWPWPRSRERKRARDILDQLEIGHLAERHIRDLSGGQQQRVFLARALVADPEVLVLDEPTTGVDVRSAENIFHWLTLLNKDGMTILLTTHDLNMAAAHVPWVVCLNRRIMSQGPPQEIFTEDILAEAYQGEFIVIRRDDMIFVQQRPHPHGLKEVLPDPVEGGLPNHDSREKIANPDSALKES
ncbi:MAG: metal ABC transporter ATP-binding protein [Caldilineaceae bacterium]|nr:metal ABC transporter ATP-binding protein [Caldilineaceae bacterium]